MQVKLKGIIQSIGKYVSTDAWISRVKLLVALLVLWVSVDE